MRHGTIASLDPRCALIRRSFMHGPLSFGNHSCWVPNARIRDYWDICFDKVLRCVKIGAIVVEYEVLVDVVKALPV